MSSPTFPQRRGLPRRLPRASSGAVGAALISLAVLAAPAAAQARFDVPAGPLETVLNRLGVQAGVLITFAPELAADAVSSGVRGATTVEDALRQALAGTALRAERTGDGFTLRRMPQTAIAPARAGVATLTPVSVTASHLGGASEDTGSYTTPAARTATGLSLSLRDTPQSVSVLTRQRMDDEGIESVEDALDSVPGIVSNSGYYVGNSGEFLSRGFAIYQIQYDGLGTSTGANGTFNADNGDMAIYDRVDVVRGATGLMQGTGQPSASVNFVRKRPTAQPRLAAQAAVGSWDQRRVQLDGAGPLNASGSVRARGVVSHRTGGGWQTGARQETNLAYGIVEIDLAPRTVLTAGGEWRHTSDRLVSDLPTRPDGSFYDLPRSTNLGNDFDFWRQTSKNVFGELSHTFANGWQARASAARYWTDLDMLFTSLARRNGQLYQNTQGYRYESEQTTLNAQLQGPFELLGRQHELIVGASYRKRTNPVQRGGWTPNASQTLIPDLADWDIHGRVPPTINDRQWSIAPVRAWESGAFAAGRFSIIDPLTVIVGARASNPYNAPSVITPYYGVVLDVDAHHSVYASRTQTHQSVAAVDINGDTLPPTTGTNLEAGVKGEYFGGRLNASAAIFQVRQNHRVLLDRSGPSPCPSNGATFCSTSSGEIKSRGFELEVSGEILPGWQLAAGYTYVSQRYVSDANPLNVGQPVDTRYPTRQFKLGTTYRLPHRLQDWTVGGTLYVQNAIAEDDIRQGGYARTDLHVGYRIDRQWDLRLNVNNVFDRKYYRYIGWSTGGNSYGAPRNAMLTVNYRH